MSEDQKPFSILFLCTGNSARSIFGEYITKFLGRDRFHAYSAGADPAGEVNPMTKKVLLERLKIDASEARSKSWDEFESKGITFDFVITVCDHAKESCPVWPGQPVIAHWSSPDPSEFEGSEKATEDYFYKVAMQIKRRVEFFCSFPLEKLDKHRLQHITQEVGEREGMNEAAAT